MAKARLNSVAGATTLGSTGSTLDRKAAEKSADANRYARNKNAAIPHLALVGMRVIGLSKSSPPYPRQSKGRAIPLPNHFKFCRPRTQQFHQFGLGRIGIVPFNPMNGQAMHFLTQS